MRKGVKREKGTRNGKRREKDLEVMGMQEKGRREREREEREQRWEGNRRVGKKIKGHRR